MSFSEWFNAFRESVAFDIIINIVASIIIAVVLFSKDGVVNAIYRKKMFETTRIRHFKKDYGKKVKFYYAKSDQYDEEEGSYLSFPCEYLSMGCIESFLKIKLPNLNVEREMTPEDLSGVLNISSDYDIVIFGGPVHNLVTRYYFDLCNPNNKAHIYFTTPEYLLHATGYNVERKDEDTRKRTKISVDSQITANRDFDVERDEKTGSFIKDHGIIINIKNPKNVKRRIILFMGSRTFGVQGAANYFSYYNKELRKALKKLPGGIPNEYAMIVKCTSSNRNIDQKIDPEMIIPLESFKESDFKSDNLGTLKEKIKNKK